MPTIPRLTFHSDAQLASHMAATNNADSPSMITIMSYCSSARVRRRRLSLAASSLMLARARAARTARVTVECGSVLGNMRELGVKRLICVVPE